MVRASHIAPPGIASHLGLWLDLPSIGCAKSILRGNYDKDALGEEPGSWVPLIDTSKKEVLGAACVHERV